MGKAKSQEKKAMQINPYGKHCGMKARRWRSSVGALATDRGNTLRAIKFPLDMKGVAEIDFSAAKDLYNIGEGVGPGSLWGFLCAAHLSGFRLFSKKEEASKFFPKTRLGGPLVYDSKRPFVEMKPDDPYALHKVVAMVAREVRLEHEDIDVSSAKFCDKINALITGSVSGTSSPNGLSWLFGVGLVEHFGNKDKKDLTIAKDAGVSKGEIKRIQQVMRFAQVITIPPPFINKKNYTHFRVVVAQKVKSWVSNYWTRTNEYEQLVQKDIILPPDLFSDKVADIFRNLSFNRDDIKEEAEDLRSQFNQFSSVVGKLRGDDKDLPDDSDFELIVRLDSRVSTFCGHLRQIQEFINQRAEATDNEDVDFWEALDKDLKEATKDVQHIKKLNQIAGGVVGVEETVKEYETMFNKLIVKRFKCCEKLFSLCEKSILDAVSSVEREKIDKAKKQGRTSEYSAHELAVRSLVARICGLSKRLSYENRETILEQIRPLFKRSKDCNKHIYNRQGAIYRSPWSTSVRHQLFEINIKEAEKFDYLSSLNNLIQKIESRLSKGKSDDVRDWLNAQQFMIQLQVEQLPESIPKEYSATLLAGKDKAIQEMFTSGRFSQFLQDKLRNGAKRHHIANALNLYQSTIRGLAYQIMRDSFTVQIVLRVIGQDKLLYVPKERTWTPPERYRKSFEKPLIAACEKSSKQLSPPNALERICEDGLGDANLKFLTQMPHDWFIPLDGYKGFDIPETKGTLIDKKRVDIEEKKVKSVPALRLVGVASMKTCLDEVMRDTAKRGEHSLILKQAYNQSRKWDKGKLLVSVERDNLNIDAAIPVESSRMEALDSKKLFHKIIAIDLGERGIAYAVFNVPEFLNGNYDNVNNIEPIEKGMLPIPSIRGLQSAVARHRGRAQPNQKIQASFSRALEKHRESVIGEVCHRIDFLCSHFDGFPVLERDVANLESKGNQLRLVYGSVVHRYCFSKIDAHKMKRGE